MGIVIINPQQFPLMQQQYAPMYQQPYGGMPL